MKVLIISGGDSSERKISLISAKEVKKALEENNFKVKIFDLRKGYQKLNKASANFDVIFPVIHGEEGEGGKLHKFLKTLNKPYIGGDWRSFKKGWYKISFKKFCELNNIPTSKWKILASHLKGVKLIREIIEFGFPSVLKANSGGSSKEVVMLKNKEDLKGFNFLNLIKSDTKLFVERFLPGIEVTVGIVGNKALPVIEIVPPKNGWFDYKNKYSGKTQKTADAPSLTESQRKKVQEVALKIHSLLKLGDYSRIDFIVTSTSSSHMSSGNGFEPYALEANTIPGMTAESLLPKAAKAAGISFPNLVKKLVEMALDDVKNSK